MDCCKVAHTAGSMSTTGPSPNAREPESQVFAAGQMSVVAIPVICFAKLSAPHLHIMP